MILGVSEAGPHEPEETQVKQAAFAVALVSTIVQVASAQGIDKTQLALKAAESRQAAQQAVKQYSWKMRTEVQVESEVRSVRMEAVRYDIDGQQQRTLMNERVLEPKRKPGLRGRMQERQADQARDWMQELGDLTQRYLNVTKGQLVDYFDKAAFKPEGNVVRIEGRNFLHPGDRMTYLVGTADHRPQRVEVETTYRGDPVKMVIEFRMTPDSLTYPARSLVTVPAKEVQIKIENFEYARS
jgi:hypothetical protein